jgi:hypothetical protein
MKTRAIASTATGVLVALALCTQAMAQATFPTTARTYIAWMARAYDECNPATLSVVGAGLPAGGCLAANGSTTDNALTMNYVRLIVKARSGRLIVFGRGFPFGARVQVQLTLRVTKAGITTKHPPGSNKRVTFEDTVVTCPNPGTQPFGFPTRANGGLLGIASLSDCLGTSVSNLARGNIEILDSALINGDTGNVIAHPGILR